MTVLVFHIGSLGDTIVTIPLLRAIRSAWPGSRVIMLHNAPVRPGLRAPADVLASTGLVDDYVPYRRHASGLLLLGELVRTWRVIRRLRVDVAIFAGPSDRAPGAIQRDRVFLSSAGIRRLIGFRRSVAPTAASLTGTAVHEAVIKLDRLGSSTDGPATASPWRMPLLTPDSEATARVVAWCQARGVEADGLVAVGPGSLMPSKAWPMERFIEIGQRLRKRGLSPMVVGGPDEHAEGERLVQHWGGGVNSCGVFSVIESAALLALCRAYVGVDSGGAHLAAAVGIRTVVLSSGRTPRGLWDPLGPGHVVLRHAVACEGCFHVSCPLIDHPCMRGLTIDEAWRALESIVQQGRA